VICYQPNALALQRFGTLTLKDVLEPVRETLMQSREPRGIAVDCRHHPHSSGAPKDGKFLICCDRWRRLSDSTSNKHVRHNI